MVSLFLQWKVPDTIDPVAEESDSVFFEKRRQVIHETRTFLDRDRFSQEKQSLFPMGRDALRPRAKARDLLFEHITLALALPSLRRRFVPDRPHLSQNHVTLFDHRNFGRGWYGMSGYSEECVEVENQGVDFSFSVGGGH